MRRALAMSVAALLAACSSPGAPVAPPSAAEAACARQADSSPEVKADLGKAAGNLDWQWQHEGQIRQAKRDAITSCLRARGLAAKGGVERPR